MRMDDKLENSINTLTNFIQRNAKKVAVVIISLTFLIFGALWIANYLQSGVLILRPSEIAEVKIFDSGGFLVKENGNVSQLKVRLKKGNYTVQASIYTDSQNASIPEKRSELAATVIARQSNDFDIELRDTLPSAKVYEETKSTNYKLFGDELYYLDQKLGQLFVRKNGVVSRIFPAIDQVRKVDWITKDSIVAITFTQEVIVSRNDLTVRKPASDFLLLSDNNNELRDLTDIVYDPLTKKIAIGIGNSVFMADENLQDFTLLHTVNYDAYDLSFRAGKLFVYRAFFAYPFPDAPANFEFKESDYTVTFTMLDSNGKSLFTMDDISYEFAELSPNGRYLAYSDNSRTYIINSTNAEVVSVYPSSRYLVWKNDDTIVYVTNDGIYESDYSDKSSYLVEYYDNPGLSQQIRSVNINESGNITYLTDAFYLVSNAFSDSTDKLNVLEESLPLIRQFYSIDYFLTADGLLTVTISTYANEDDGAEVFRIDTQKYRDEALLELKSLGIDPTTIKLIYSPST